MAHARTYHIGRWLVLIAGISLLSLVLMEVALRTAGFYYTYTEKMDHEYISHYGRVMPTWYWGYHPFDSLIDIKPEYTYRSRTNAMGYRDTNFDTTEHKGKKVWMVLGDSFVQGLGAPADSTWPHLLEPLINVDQHTNRIYNCGVAGSDPFFEYVDLRDHLIRLHPDVVIMSINYSDVIDCITRGGMERFHSDGTTHFRNSPWFEPFYKRLHVVRLLTHFILRYDFTLLSPAQHQLRLSEAVNMLAGCASKTKALCDSHGVKCLIVIHPYLDPYDRYLRNQDQLPQLEKILRSQGISAISLFGDMQAIITEQNYSTYSWRKDMHYTSRGYDLFAYLLACRIEKDYPDLLSSRANSIVATSPSW